MLILLAHCSGPPQPVQKLCPLGAWLWGIGLLILIDFIASRVEINLSRWMQSPPTTSTDSPDFVATVQHNENWGAQVRKEEAICCPVSIGENRPAVGLFQVSMTELGI